MSSMAQKMQSNKSGAGGGGKEDTYISSKEDKEAMLNRKMEEIRRKNEALRKRHEMIQADRIAAEKSGQAINLKQAATSEPLPPHKPQMRGTYADNDGQEGRKSKFAAGRGKRLANRSKEELRAQNYEVKPRSEGNSPGSKQSSGSGRTQEPKSPSDGPPPDPGYSFLADRSREGPLPESRGGRKEQYERDNRGDRSSGGGGRRHPRNFGGGDFSNVKQKIQHDRYSQGKPRGSVKSEMDMQLHMTGKERREYVEWKKEREKIDMIRMERQKTAEGDWRREWDREKDEQAFDSTPAPPMSRHIEPARRPAGRIGSGRFDRGDDERAAGPGYEPEDRIERGPDRGGERGARGFRGGRDERRGRGGGGRGARGGSSGDQGGGRGGRGGRRPEEKQRTFSAGSDDRSVEEQNDSLLIKVDNEFAQRGGRGGRGGGRGAKKRGGRSGPPERTGEPKHKESSDDDTQNKNQEKAESKDNQVPKPEERKFRFGAPRGAKNKKAVGSGRIGSGRLAASHDDEEVIIEDEEGNQTRRHLNSSSGSTGEWETDTSSQSLTADGDEPGHNAEEDDYWEDDEEFYKFQSTELDEDLHNSSLESFDDSSFHRFIEKNTLRIDAKTGLPTRDKSGQHIPPGAVPVTPTSPDPTSPLHSLKTPTDHKKILDWGAEMDALSPSNSKSGTNSSQSPNESPKHKSKGDDQSISISDHDDSVNTSTEAKRQIIFPEEDEEKPEKLETKSATVGNVQETATDKTEPEEKRGQVDEKDATRQDTNKSSDIEDKESNVEDKVEKKVEGVATAAKEEGDEEDDEFEDAAEDEEADEFVDAGSNVATPLAGSREVSAESTPQTSPQHKANVKRQEDVSLDDNDVTNEEIEDKSSDNDVTKEETEDRKSSDNDVTNEETEDRKFNDNDVTNEETEDIKSNDIDVINEETGGDNKSSEDVTKEDLAQKPDDVTETVDDAKSKPDETELSSGDTKDIKDDTTKDDITSENLETSDKDNVADSSQAEEEKPEQQNGSVGETDGANVNNTVTSPTEGTEETVSPPSQDGVTVDKSQSETELTDSVNKQSEVDDTTTQPKTDVDTSEEKTESAEKEPESKEDSGSDSKPESS